MTKGAILDAGSREELLRFAADLVRIQSYSGREEKAVRFIAGRMADLGFDEVKLDGFGNVLGRIGRGGKSILFDSHVDTVEVKDEGEWTHPPFGGEIAEGSLWGRGSVDMKSSAAASIYAAALAKRAGLAEGTTIYVSCTVFEEDCDGENLRHLFGETGIRPDACVICEPSNNLIALGHKGKAQILVRTRGVSAHGSAPEKGVNAIYEMAEIIRRVERVNLELARRERPRGSLVMSRISSTSASLNAVPSECEVYLDRRMVVGETEETIKKEMDAIVAGKNAAWEIGALQRTTWTGLDLRYEPFHLAWELDPGHRLSRLLIEAYEETFGSRPEKYDYWDFSTNAVATVREGIPTIGFGAGDHKQAHMRDEHCPVDQIVDACGMYVNVMRRFG
ncbi:MAG: YgeY family selenium metabolism-linked hydrolase [Treponema sp.]|nr:YgeY family selenium metabolism-linked hydrolase [Treponema sp.]